MQVSHYVKAIVAVVGVALTATEAAISDGVFETQEWWQIGIAVLVAAGVYQFPNMPRPAVVRRQEPPEKTFGG